MAALALIGVLFAGLELAPNAAARGAVESYEGGCGGASSGSGSGGSGAAQQGGAGEQAQGGGSSPDSSSKADCATLKIGAELDALRRLNELKKLKLSELDVEGTNKYLREAGTIYNHLSPEEQGKIQELIGKRPELYESRVLSGIKLPDQPLGGMRDALGSQAEPKRWGGLFDGALAQANRAAPPPDAVRSVGASDTTASTKTPPISTGREVPPPGPPGTEESLPTRVVRTVGAGLGVVGEKIGSAMQAVYGAAAVDFGGKVKDLGNVYGLTGKALDWIGGTVGSDRLSAAGAEIGKAGDLLREAGGRTAAEGASLTVGSLARGVNAVGAIVKQPFGDKTPLIDISGQRYKTFVGEIVNKQLDPEFRDHGWSGQKVASLGHTDKFLESRIDHFSKESGPYKVLGNAGVILASAADKFIQVFATPAALAKVGGAAIQGPAIAATGLGLAEEAGHRYQEYQQAPPEAKGAAGVKAVKSFADTVASFGAGKYASHPEPAPRLLEASAGPTPSPGSKVAPQASVKDAPSKSWWAWTQEKVFGSDAAEAPAKAQTPEMLWREEAARVGLGEPPTKADVDRYFELKALDGPDGTPTLNDREIRVQMFMESMQEKGGYQPIERAVGPARAETSPESGGGLSSLPTNQRLLAQAEKILGSGFRAESNFGKDLRNALQAQDYSGARRLLQGEPLSAADRISGAVRDFFGGPKPISIDTLSKLFEGKPELQAAVAELHASLANMPDNPALAGARAHQKAGDYAEAFRETQAALRDPSRDFKSPEGSALKQRLENIQSEIKNAGAGERVYFDDWRDRTGRFPRQPTAEEIKTWAERRRAEDPDSVVGTPSGKTVDLQCKSDCAIRSITNNNSTSLVNKQMSYDKQLLPLAEKVVGHEYKGAGEGTSIEAKRELLGRLGWDLTERIQPRLEKDLVSAVREGDGVFADLSFDRSGPGSKPQDKFSHAVAITSAIRDGGRWWFEVRDSNSRQPRLLTFEELSLMDAHVYRAVPKLDSLPSAPDGVSVEWRQRRQIQNTLGEATLDLPELK